MNKKLSLPNLCERISKCIEFSAIPPELLVDLQTATRAPEWEAKLDHWCDQQSTTCDLVYQAVANVTDIAWRSTLGDLTVSTEFTRQFPIALAREHSVVGFEASDDSLLLAAGRCSSLVQQDIVRRLLDRPVKVCLTGQSQIGSVINAAYQVRDSQTVESIGALDPGDALRSLTQAAGREDLLDSSGRSPVVRLVNSILFDAVQNRASDIHIQPFEDDLQVRFRIDGILFDQFKVPKASQEEVLSRIKVVGDMNIAEKRLPQDGRASVKIGDRMIDLRIASLPTNFGERIVIRLLDKSARLYSLEELGMPSKTLHEFRQLIHLEHGLILVTGPTGGGKSTTLYAGLQEINTHFSNVVTLEDPIEYQLTGISQTQVSEKKGLTFADGLRSVLRQDPDIIMVGEIRDRETAEMAIQSALTGHMVFSTLHTNDAASAVNRLLDLGIEPYLVASSLVGVLAQRLVRRICPECKVENTNEALVGNERYGLADAANETGFLGAGCETCRNTGYHGRIGLFELMTVNDQIRQLVQQRSNAAEICSAAKTLGMNSLRDDGIEKVREGKTTSEEVVRVSAQSATET